MDDQRRRPSRDGEHPLIRGIFVVAAVAGIVGVMAQLHIPPFNGGTPTPAPTSTPGPTFAPGPTPTSPGPFGCAAPTLSLSKGSGPSGTHVVVSGSGFPANEPVEMRFHTELLPPSQTGPDGTFQVEIVVPGTFDSFVGQQFTISAVTSPSICHKEAPFKLTG